MLSCHELDGHIVAGILARLCSYTLHMGRWSVVDEMDVTAKTAERGHSETCRVITLTVPEEVSVHHHREGHSLLRQLLV